MSVIPSAARPPWGIDKNGQTWFDYYSGHQSRADLAHRLDEALTMFNLFFDHVQVGAPGSRRLCVFVAKGDQSAVLYDKIKGFPSAKLMASLVLLGSK